ncbi:MAG: peptide-methionine (S)-S-oxide reductase MsrA, partial [Phycisphaerales bacterium]|nr:peptide-methionine (S)-S-oxide reductase MsrA [Phycisphaerales bacterium]
VTSGRTGHAEAVKIVFDPTVIDFATLLKVHFATHDPTTLNRQGADVGPQYRSAVFYANDQEKAAAESFIRSLTESKVFARPIVTTIEPLTKFHEAERYHQNYVCENPDNPYVRGVAWPKVKKVREQFGDRLKDESPLGR